MRNRWRIGTALACTFLLAGAAAVAQEQHNHHEATARPAPRGEPHPGPKGYQRVAPPKGWDARPTAVDHASYQHNFRAARSFHIGPYQRPAGWRSRTWSFGEILPRAYWAPQYILADYWLFALEVPPAGYEWVRDGSDALLISVDTGEILQVEYGVFA